MNSQHIEGAMVRVNRSGNACTELLQYQDILVYCKICKIVLVLLTNITAEYQV